jgi:chromosome segregation ATPase
LSNEDLKRDIHGFKNKIKQLESDLHEQRTKITILTPKANEYEGLVDSKHILENQVHDLQNEVKSYQNLYEEMKVKHERDRMAKADEIKGLYDQMSALRGELRSCKDELTHNSIEKDNILKDNRFLQDELEKKQQTVISYSREINELRRSLESKQDEISKKISQLENVENEVLSLNKFVEECDNKLKGAYEVREKMSIDMENLTRENHKIRDQNHKLTKTVEDLTSVNKKLTVNSENIYASFEACERHLRFLLQSIDTTFNPNYKADNFDQLLDLFSDRVKEIHHEKEMMRKKVGELQTENSGLQGDLTRNELRVEKLHQEY